MIDTLITICVIALIGVIINVRLKDNSGASSYDAWRTEDEAKYPELYD